MGSNPTGGTKERCANGKRSGWKPAAYDEYRSQGSNPCLSATRKVGRAVDCACFENRLCESTQRFESSTFRHALVVQRIVRYLPRVEIPSSNLGKGTNRRCRIEVDCTALVMRRGNPITGSNPVIGSTWRMW